MIKQGADSLEFCCGKLEMSYKRNFVDILLDLVSKHPTVWINGETKMVDDGDGYFDDMTDSSEISHCPYCGAKFSKE